MPEIILDTSAAIADLRAWHATQGRPRITLEQYQRRWGNLEHLRNGELLLQSAHWHFLRHTPKKLSETEADDPMVAFLLIVADALEALGMTTVELADDPEAVGRLTLHLTGKAPVDTCYRSDLTNDAEASFDKTRLSFRQKPEGIELEFTGEYLRYVLVDQLSGTGIPTSEDPAYLHTVTWKSVISIEEYEDLRAIYGESPGMILLDEVAADA